MLYFSAWIKVNIKLLKDIKEFVSYYILHKLVPYLNEIRMKRLSRLIICVFSKIIMYTLVVLMFNLYFCLAN